MPTRLLALARFYAIGAAGVALRNAIGAAMGLVLSLVLVPDAEIAILGVAGDLVGVGGRWPARWLLVGLALSLTWRSGPLLRLGLGGWLRSAAVSGADHRRAMGMALVVPQLSLIAAVLGAIGLIRVASNVAVDGLAVTSALAIIPLAAAAGVPVERRAAGWLIGTAGAGFAATGTIPGLAGAVVALFLWDRAAGPVIPDRPRPTTGAASRWLAVAITWRALGPRSLIAVVPALLMLGGAWLYRINNGLDADQALWSARLAATLGPLVTFGRLGDRLVEVRRPWPWSRSLPWSAASRTALDGAAFAAYSLPTLLLAGLLDWRAVAVGLMVLPAGCFLAVGAHRRAAGRHLRATGELVVTGGAVAAGVAWSPWAAGAMLLAAPFLWWYAARADRRLVATGWQDLHHGAIGDSLAGDAR
ncbi:MAG: hypothetical protein ACKVZ0_16465 [Gemmatimonadales bacterium]